MILGIITGIFALILVIFVIIWLLLLNPYRTIHSDKKKIVSKNILVKSLLKLDKKNPFSVKKDKKYDLAIEWNIVGAKWRDTFGKAWKNKVYKSWMRIDEEKKEIRYCEEIIEKQKSMGVIKFYGLSYMFKGAELFQKEYVYQSGIKSNHSIGEIYKYNFTPENLKNIIRKISLDNGWNFRLVISKRYL